MGVPFIPKDNKYINEFVIGMEGDPTELADATERMYYFSAIVLTTLGFGDIVPLTTTARALVASEVILGVLFAGLFINAASSRKAAPPATRIKD